MKNTTRYCVYIGRFQPFTPAHLETVNIALKHCDRLVLLIGSPNKSISIINPFSVPERKKIIAAALDEAGVSDSVIVSTVPDSAYNFTAWTAKVQEITASLTGNSENIMIIGHYKDDSSYYLKHFPMWELIKVPELQNGLSATMIRTMIFEDRTDWQEFYRRNPATLDVILQIINEQNTRFDNLKEEYRFLQDYKKKWESAPFPPVFVTTDAVVFCMGHVLLVRRKLNPGKGRLALPGGFLGQDEYLFDSCIRELKEETKIDIPYPVLKSSLSKQNVFDHPRRSLRGRTITHAYLFELSNQKGLPAVKPADDAEEAMWVPLSRIEELSEEFFSDHLMIIKYFLGRSI